jgi:hypothetical protein
MSPLPSRVIERLVDKHILKVCAKLTDETCAALQTIIKQPIVTPEIISAGRSKGTAAVKGSMLKDSIKFVAALLGSVVAVSALAHSSALEPLMSLPQVATLLNMTPSSAKNLVLLAGPFAAKYIMGRMSEAAKGFVGKKAPPAPSSGGRKSFRV